MIKHKKIDEMKSRDINAVDVITVEWIKSASKLKKEALIAPQVPPQLMVFKTPCKFLKIKVILYIPNYNHPPSPSVREGGYS